MKYQYYIYSEPELIGLDIELDEPLPLAVGHQLLLNTNVVSSRVGYALFVKHIRHVITRLDETRPLDRHDIHVFCREEATPVLP